jgi:hypothetical protein
MEIEFSDHGQKRTSGRGIALAWIEATVSAPDWTKPDPDPALTRSYKAIAEFGGRILRVVHRPEGDKVLIVTVHFDRSAKR